LLAASDAEPSAGWNVGSAPDRSILVDGERHPQLEPGTSIDAQDVVEKKRDGIGSIELLAGFFRVFFEGFRRWRGVQADQRRAVRFRDS